MNTKSDYLYIFLHIQKTAGSTVRKHIEENYAEGERLLIQIPEYKLNTKAKSYKSYKDQCQALVGNLSKKEKDSIKLIYGHHVPYGVHKLFNRKYRYITFFRDPKSRIISLYNFYLSRYQREPKSKKNDVSYKLCLLIDGKVPDFSTWLDKKYGKRNLTLRTCEQTLRDLGYLKNASIDGIRRTIGKFYFVGLTERSSYDLPFLYWLLRIKKYFLSQNISIKYVRNQEINKNIKLLEKVSKVDKVIYKSAVNANTEFRNKNQHFKHIVGKIRRERGRKMMLTHLIRDPKNYMIVLSQFLRRKSKVYSNTVDFIIRRDR